MPIALLIGARINQHLHARNVLPRLSHGTISSRMKLIRKPLCLIFNKILQINRITTGVIEADRPGEVSEPYQLDTKWDFQVCWRIANANRRSHSPTSSFAFILIVLSHSFSVGVSMEVDMNNRLITLVPMTFA